MGNVQGGNVVLLASRASREYRFGAEGVEQWSVRRAEEQGGHLPHLPAWKLEGCKAISHLQ